MKKSDPSGLLPLQFLRQTADYSVTVPPSQPTLLQSSSDLSRFVVKENHDRGFMKSMNLISFPHSNTSTRSRTKRVETD
ncbi:unnamed protein product [Linum tenue]|uniref:Uncharacterized protein n=1 Tax=Linum tenue TaxID=586396 RepID=A0AAV0IFH5_9ROSI|nr:unnamed protein product [Linum tenue]